MIYFQEKKYQEAENQLLSSLKKYKEIGFKNNIASVLNQLAHVKSAENNWNISLDYINQSIDINKSIGAIANLSEDYLLRSRIYEQLNRVNPALLDLKQHQIITDSLFSATKSQQIEELRTIYETEKKEQQIQIQKNEIDLLNIKSKVNNQQRLLMALGLLLALIGVYAFYQRNKRNKLAKEKAEADLEFKTKELTTHALHLAKKNEVLNDLKEKAKVLKADAGARQIAFKPHSWQ